eukprot:6120593-Pyramimonas_sp.AAC.1
MHERRPKIASKKPEKLARGLQDGPRGLQEDLQLEPKRTNSLICIGFSKDVDRRAFSAFRRLQTFRHIPKIAQRSPQRPPRWLHDSPRSSHDGLKAVPNGSQDAQDGL